MIKHLCVAVMLCATAFGVSLEQELNALIAKHHGKVALWARDIKTGRTIAIHAGTPAKTASVIKVPVMLEAYREASEGKLNLEDKVTLTKDNVTDGSGVLQFMEPGLQLTVRDAIAMMIILSDNTGTNLVIDTVGTRAVNERLQANGYKSTWLYKKVGKPPTEPMPPDQKEFGLGKSTAEEMGRIMESIARCKIGQPKLCEEMMHLMKNQSYRGMIPRFIETVDTTEIPSAIAGKIGMLDDVRNDVSVVATKCGQIVISAFTWDNKDQRWTPDVESEILIGRMAQKIVGTWCPAGLKGN